MQEGLIWPPLHILCLGGGRTFEDSHPDDSSVLSVPDLDCDRDRDCARDRGRDCDRNRDRGRKPGDRPCGSRANHGVHNQHERRDTFFLRS